MRKLIYIAAVAVSVLVVIAGLWRLSNSRTYQVFGEIIPRVETQDNVVALTFDDGPTPDFTHEILRILEENEVKATFFLIGGELEKHLDEGKKIVSAGHEIGNHTFSHVRMIVVTPGVVKEEIEKTDNLIRAAGYDKPIHFRPPYGKKLLALPFYLSRNNRKTITWDVEPESFPAIAKSTEDITNYVVANSRSGSIILLHVMYDRERKSLNAVGPIIEALKTKGFRFVTVSKLIGS
jgi:peptidoglycan-N-acetylglucosamine deacetylase